MKKLFRPRFAAKTAAMLMGAALLAAQANSSFAAVDDAGVGEVRKQVEAAIAMPLEMEKANGMGLALGGPVEVAAKGDYYEVKLPDVTYAMQGMKANFGTITMNVTPDGEQYKVTMAMPSTILITDPAKAPVAEIKLGDQQFSGIWLTKYRAFTKFDANYKNITVTSAKEGSKVSITVDTLKSTLDLKQDSGDIWSGPANFEITGMHLAAGTRGEFEANIDNVTGAASYSKLNMQVRKDVEDKTEQALQAQQKKQKPDPAQVQAMLSSVVNSIQDYIDGMGSSFKFSGITMKINPGDAKDAQGKAEKPVDLHLASASWGFKIDGMQQEKGGVSLNFGMEGLSVANMDEATKAIVPTDSNLEIHLDNLPFQQLSKGLSGVFSQIVSSAVATQSVTDATQKAALQSQVQAQVAAAMATVPSTLATAGAKLSILNTFTKSPDVGTTLEGAFTASTASSVLAQGNLTLLITGLDELVVKLQGLAQGANADPKIMGWAQGLGMVEMMGQLGKAPDGRSQRSFKLEVTPEGKVTLNGADLGATMGAMGLGKGAATPTPVTPVPAPDKDEEKDASPTPDAPKTP